MPFIEQAKLCDADAATKFAKVVGESAETIALAAFQKCLLQWEVATKKSIEAQKRYSTVEELRANPYLGSVEMGYNSGIEARNGIEAWKASEVNRLRLIVIEQRIP